MSVKRKMKSVIKWLLNSIPARKFVVNNITLSQNTLLDGRCALITGGTSGIGYCIAETFLKSGASVIITGRHEVKLNQALEKLKRSSMVTDRVSGIVMDISDISSMASKFMSIERVDMLVNNAGILSNSIPSVSEKEFDNVINTNLKGAYFLSQLVAERMIESKIEGNILNICSSSSLRPAISPYTLSKWGLRGFTIGLAKSLAPHGITVNGLAPGPTATPMLIKDNTDNYLELKTSPIGRYLLPEEIANLALVLVSPLGRGVVGDIIYCTGGCGTITYEDMDYSVFGR